MKKILVFSNGEKIGDGIIKLPLLHEIKTRLPNVKIYWMTQHGKTVYNGRLKNIASQYIDFFYEQANLQPFFWKKISNKFDFEAMHFDFIFDTQKAVFRTLALKRIKHDFFISAAASGLLSSKIKFSYTKNRKYYLDELFDLLDLIKTREAQNEFSIEIPKELLSDLKKIFDKDKKYIGFAPGAGESDRIWNINNFIEVARHFEKLGHINVFFLGPDDKKIEALIRNIFPNSIYPEDKIDNFTGPEVVMGCTLFLDCALSNDSGVGHMLSTHNCPLIKLFGPKDSTKFTPPSKNIFTISSIEFGTKNIDAIPIDEVKRLITKVISK